MCAWFVQCGRAGIVPSLARAIHGHCWREKERQDNLDETGGTGASAYWWGGEVEAAGIGGAYWLGDCRRLAELQLAQCPVLG